MQKPTKSKTKNLRLIKKSVVNKRATNGQSIIEAGGVEPDKIPTEQADTAMNVTGVTNEERLQLIATAAYLRAERRNFTPGCELDDWLEAEAEIETKLASIAADSQPKNA
jgi:hypothetical protein